MEHPTLEEQLEFEMEFNDYIDMQSRLAYWYEEFDRLAQEQEGHYHFSDSGPG